MIDAPPGAAKSPTWRAWVALSQAADYAPAPFADRA
jgi:hypothetical protein